jgi:hypothetical protein
MLCSVTSQRQGNQFISGTAVSAIVPVEWKVVAHEIGHNFGAEHDCTSTQCPCKGSECNCQPCGNDCDCKGQFLMHPLDNAATDEFSSASINSICGAFPRLGKCLKDPASFKNVEIGICGNGVKENKEECDCGQPEDCADKCCDAATCKLKQGSQCADGNDSCCLDCKIRGNGTVCHPSAGVCDNTVTCDGVSANCRADSYKPNGESCKAADGSSAQCASGICTSRDKQCQTSGFINTVRACKSFFADCALSCETPQGICYRLNGDFLDGTPCSGGGTCQLGKCEGSNICRFN